MVEICHLSSYQDQNHPSGKYFYRKQHVYKQVDEYASPRSAPVLYNLKFVDTVICLCPCNIAE